MEIQAFFEQHLQYKKTEKMVKKATDLTLNEVWILYALLESNVSELFLRIFSTL